MKKLILAAPIVLALAACQAETEAVDAAESAAGAEAALPAPADAPEGDETLGEIALDPNWTTRVSPDIPYYNSLEKPVSVYESADPDSPVVAEIAPGEGGFVRNCALDSDICELEYGSARTGWVNIADFKGNAM